MAPFGRFVRKTKALMATFGLAAYLVTYACIYDT